MNHKQYHQMEPQSGTCWNRCGSKFSCNGDCPNKGERVDMTDKEVQEVQVKLNRGEEVFVVPRPKITPGVWPGMHQEQTTFGKDSGVSIIWNDTLEEEDIDHAEQWMRLQFKKIRRMCKKNPESS